MRKKGIKKHEDHSATLPLFTYDGKTVYIPYTQYEATVFCKIYDFIIKETGKENVLKGLEIMPSAVLGDIIF